MGCLGAEFRFVGVWVRRAVFVRSLGSSEFGFVRLYVCRNVGSSDFGLVEFGFIALLLVGFASSECRFLVICM